VASASKGRGAHQLPAGRHGLSREFVVANQRERILDATLAVASAAGYEAMSVEDIVSVAGVSRRTFYDYYRNKHEAFLDCYERVAMGLLGAVGDAYDPEVPLALRGELCLRAAMEYFAADPASTDVCIVQARASGPDAMERRDNAIAALAQIIDQAALEVPKATRPPEMTSRAIIGGINEIVHSRVLRGELAELPGMVPDMLYALLLPYVGPDEAEIARKAATARTNKKAKAA
jgi:AcrR family transcriptional regulator